MAIASEVAEDGSLPSRMDLALARLERAMLLAGGLAAFSLTFLAVYSVAGRKFFAAPLLGYVDYIETLMPLIAVVGVSAVQRDGGHIRMDIIVGRLRGRALWALELLATLLLLALAAALLWGSWAHFARSFEWSAPLWSSDSSIDVGLPLWPSKLLVPVALAVLCLRLSLQAWCYARALGAGSARPVGVPLPQSVEDHARSAAAELEGPG